MLSLSAKDRVFLAVKPVDFRKQIRGLVMMTQSIIHQDPYSGYYFVFINKKHNAIKSIHYDGQGYWLHQKVLSEGKFNWWPQGTEPVEIDSAKLLVLMRNGNPESASFAQDWKRVAV